jgi:hypothetical protein
MMPGQSVRPLLWGLSLALGIVASTPLFAAEAGKAEEVRAYATEVDAQIAQMQSSPESAQYGRYYCISLSVNPYHRPWPAVGIYEKDYTFYFDKEDGDAGKREPRPYPDRLVKAVCVRRISEQTLKQQFWYMDSRPVLRQCEQAGAKVRPALARFSLPSRAGGPKGSGRTP